MSRIGKQQIEGPKGVKISIRDRTVTVEGPKGSVSMQHRPEVKVHWDESEKAVTCTVDEARAGDRQTRAYWGLTRALIQNMIVGVTQGYERTMEIVGVGWTATVAGRNLRLQVGYASPVQLVIPEGISVNVEKQIVKIAGPDKQAVGQFAAAVRSVRKPEPYNGKGIKYADEVIKRKQGKQFGA